MSIRLKCSSCRAVFLTSDDNVGQLVDCPKCRAKQRVPSTALVVDSGESKSSVFVPSEQEESRPRKRRLLSTMIALGLIAAISTAGIIAWPRIRAWLRPVPPDPIEIVASKFLNAIVAENAEDLSQTSIVAEPPAIRAVHQVQHEREKDRRLKGSFRPIAELHERIASKFEYDPTIGRFKSLNPLGPAAETLDALHDAKENGEAEEIAKKIESGNPEDLFDAAEKLGQTFTKLAEGALAPEKLLPTYKQLVLDSKPPLPPTELELALNFDKSKENWDRLLKRPFPTLKADGPYLLERAEVVAQVTDKLASSGEPRTELHLKLMRFRLEGIDTSWKVVSARRGNAPEPEEVPQQKVEAESPTSSRHETMP